MQIEDDMTLKRHIILICDHGSKKADQKEDVFSCIGKD